MSAQTGELNALGLSSYGLQSTSLEEVFLYLASHVLPEMEDNEQEQNTMAADEYDAQTDGPPCSDAHRPTGGASSAQGHTGTSPTAGHTGTSHIEGHTGTSPIEGLAGMSTTEGHIGTSFEGLAGMSTTEGHAGASSCEGLAGMSTPEGHAGTSSCEGQAGTSSFEGLPGVPDLLHASSVSTAMGVRPMDSAAINTALIDQRAHEFSEGAPLFFHHPYVSLRF